MYGFLCFLFLSLIVIFKEKGFFYYLGRRKLYDYRININGGISLEIFIGKGKK